MGTRLVVKETSLDWAGQGYWLGLSGKEASWQAEYSPDTSSRGKRQKPESWPNEAERPAPWKGNKSQENRREAKSELRGETKSDCIY